MGKKVWLVVLMAALLCPLLAGAGEVKSKYDVDFYGYVKLDAIYQMGYAFPGLDFILNAPPGNYVGFPNNAAYGSATSTIRRPRGDEQENRDADAFGMTARQSRFGFLITGPQTDGGITTRARLEMDFYGYDPGRKASSNQDPIENSGELRLRRAYVEIMGDNWSVLAGNEWMVISPIFPMLTGNYPYGADIGSLGYRTPQIRLTGYALDKKLKLEVAFDNKLGDPEAFGFDVDTGRAFGAPAYEYGITYASEGLMIAYTGHWAEEEIQSTRRGNLGHFGERVNSYSNNVSIKVPIGDAIAIGGEYFEGANLDGWITGAQENGWLMNRHGDIEPLHCSGGWADIELKPMDNVKINGGWGLDDVSDNQLRLATLKPGYYGMPGDLAITKNQMWFANVGYNVTSSTMITMEWLQVISEYENATAKHVTAAAGGPGPGIPHRQFDNGVVNRYTLSFWYIF
ncbi:MAG TPA: hypothetical protein VM658_11345 [bacterium]|nr:hypothetical protein [bacterium]